MEILKFKTDISDNNAIEKVTPFLNRLEAVSKWRVDPDNADNILSISGDNLDPQQVKNALTEAGFKAEVLRVLGIGGEEM